MTGNVCPKCGKAVMPYSRFLREAEPYRISNCGSCGVKLRRSPKVYLLFPIMCIVLGLIGVPVFLQLTKAQVHNWISMIIIIVLLTGWTFLTNYLGWRFIGWVPLEDDKKSQV